MEPRPQKTAEMLLLEQVAEDVRAIKVKCERFDRQSLVLRTQFTRLQADHSGTAKTVTAHEKKINFALGGTFVVGALITYVMAIWKKFGGG